MNERTHFFIKTYLSHFILEMGWCFCGVWEMGGETYTQREDFFFPYLLPGAWVANSCTPLQAETPLIGCVSYARLWFSALCLNLTAWFSSCGLLPVTHLLYPTTLIVLSCLLITTWQLVKEQWVTRNEPKIHGICYITSFLPKWHQTELHCQLLYFRLWIRILKYILTGIYFLFYHLVKILEFAHLEYVTLVFIYL